MIKRKSRLVIIWSCFLVAAVLMLSLMGYYFFISWKEEEAEKHYRLIVQELNAKIFAKYVSVTGVVAKIEQEGLLEGLPVLEGSIKNTSVKKVTLLKIKTFFLDKDNSVIYLDSFYPLGGENYLLPNDSISFKHLLRKAPKELRNYLVMRQSFAKAEEPLKITLRWQIEALDIE